MTNGLYCFPWFTIQTGSQVPGLTGSRGLTQTWMDSGAEEWAGGASKCSADPGPDAGGLCPPCPQPPQLHQQQETPSHAPTFLPDFRAALTSQEPQFLLPLKDARDGRNLSEPVRGCRLRERVGQGPWVCPLDSVMFGGWAISPCTRPPPASTLVPGGSSQVCHPRPP